jgi:hypothetical protein
MSIARSLWVDSSSAAKFRNCSGLVADYVRDAVAQDCFCSVAFEIREMNRRGRALASRREMTNVGRAASSDAAKGEIPIGLCNPRCVWITRVAVNGWLALKIGNPNASRCQIVSVFLADPFAAEEHTVTFGMQVVALRPPFAQVAIVVCTVARNVATVDILLAASVLF